MKDNIFNRCDIAKGNYVVLCREDSSKGIKGKFQLAANTAFKTLEDAIRYRESISPSRDPIIALTL